MTFRAEGALAYLRAERSGRPADVQIRGDNPPGTDSHRNPHTGLTLELQQPIPLHRLERRRGEIPDRQTGFDVPTGSHYPYVRVKFPGRHPAYGSQRRPDPHAGDDRLHERRPRVVRNEAVETQISRSCIVSVLQRPGCRTRSGHRHAPEAVIRHAEWRQTKAQKQAGTGLAGGARPHRQPVPYQGHVRPERQTRRVPVDRRRVVGHRDECPAHAGRPGSHLAEPLREGGGRRGGQDDDKGDPPQHRRHGAELTVRRAPVTFTHGTTSDRRGETSKHWLSYLVCGKLGRICGPIAAGLSSNDTHMATTTVTAGPPPPPQHPPPPLPPRASP